MDNFFETLYKYVEKPVRYIGNEFNAIVKKNDDVDLRWVLAYPDLYEIGMSHTGLKILYHILNKQKNILAERVFAVADDMSDFMKSKSKKLYSLETRQDVNGFDILGITIQSEVTYTSILHILEMSDITRYAKDRKEDEPIVIAGGPATYNPEPIAPFFDAILIGDGEEAVLEISEVMIKLKNKTRQVKLDGLSKIKGVYIPSKFSFEYDKDGKIIERIALDDDYTFVSRALVVDLDKADFPEDIIVSNVKLIHDRIGVEIQRGCTRGCRFCQAGMTTRPVRQRSPQTIKKILKNSVGKTGIDELGLLSLSVGDYDCIEPLMSELIEEHAPKHLSVSLPSLRTETVTDKMIKEASKFKQTGFTLAPEAGSDRMRVLINKGNKEKDLLEAVDRIFKNGWDHIKLYFMIGFPTGTLQDSKAIASLSNKVASVGRKYFRTPKVSISVNVFIPKCFTPFQWSAMLSKDDYFPRREAIFLNKNKNVKVSMNYYEEALVDGLLSRGNRLLAPVIERVYKEGGTLEGWSENFEIDRWYNALKAEDLSLDMFLGEREQTEILPWDHLDAGVSKSYLWSEYEKSIKGIKTEDCLTGKCSLCDACDFKVVKNRQYLKKKEYTDFELDSFSEVKYSEEDFVRNHKYFLRFEKKYPTTTFSHLDMQRVFMRLFTRLEIPITYSHGYTQRIMLKFYAALALGIESNDEWVEFFTHKKLSELEILEELNKNIVGGIKFLELKEIKNSKTLEYQLRLLHYRFEFLESQDDKVINYKNNSKDYKIIRLTKKKKEKVYKLIDYIDSIETSSDGKIVEIKVLFDERRVTIRYSELLKSIFNTEISSKKLLKITKLGQEIKLES